MRLNMNTYKINKEIAKKWYMQNGYKDYKNAISNITLLTGVPCIVSAIWVGEIENWPEDVVRSIIKLKEFYGYEEVSNTPIGCPV